MSRTALLSSPYNSSYDTSNSGEVKMFLKNCPFQILNQFSTVAKNWMEVSPLDFAPKTKFLNKNDCWLAKDKMATVGDFSFSLQFDYENQ